MKRNWGYIALRNTSLFRSFGIFSFSSCRSAVKPRFVPAGHVGPIFVAFGRGRGQRPPSAESRIQSHYLGPRERGQPRRKLQEQVRDFNIPLTRIYIILFVRPHTATFNAIVEIDRILWSVISRRRKTTATLLHFCARSVCRIQTPRLTVVGQKNQKSLIIITYHTIS